MEINLNTSGSKYAKQENLIKVAQVVDSNANLEEFRYAELIARDNKQADYTNDVQEIFYRALKDLIEAIDETIPTKYRPKFNTKAEDILIRTRNSLEQFEELRSEDLHSHLDFLSEKYNISN